MMQQTSYNVEAKFDVPCVLRDGTVLRANVFSPDTSEPVPVLVVRHPYSKDNPLSMGHMRFMRVARAGYIVVFVDVRGRFASEGEFTPTAQESNDGADVVRWAAELPGSSGVVGGWGASYGAETQWSAFLGGAKELKTIVPVNCPSHTHLRGFLMRGGAHELGSRLGWSHSNALEAGRRMDPTPVGIRAALEAHAEMQEKFDSEEIYKVRPMSELEPLEPFVNECAQIFGLPSADVSRRINMTAGRYDQVDIPVFVVAGWFDVFLGSAIAQYEGVRSSALAAGSPEPHLVVGPWSHRSMGDRLGDLAFGTKASALVIGDDADLTSQHIRWYDATLKGRKELLKEVPPVRLFVMGSNEWVTASQFPPRSAEAQEWYLTSEGGLRPVPGVAGVAEYAYDPENPVRTLGGASLMAAPFEPGPFDQRAIELREDVLSFTSDELGDDLTVIGQITVVLHASSTAIDTDFVARLCDVHPDGTSIGIADGIIRASARAGDGGLDDSPAETSVIEPGVVYEYTIDLLVTAMTFKAGHRLRIDVTSSCFPRWDANLNTGKTFFNSAESIVAQQSVFYGDVYPSRIILPVVDGAQISQGHLE